jgi:SAM-dependent methyltransferase
MEKNKFTYTGGENLEMMCEAKKYNSFLASLVLAQKINPSAKILDIGAGIGTVAEILREKGCDISCFEPDLNQARILTEKGFPVYTSLEEIATDFDFIYAFNVLEHIENDTDAINSWGGKTGRPTADLCAGFQYAIFRYGQKSGAFQALYTQNIDAESLGDRTKREKNSKVCGLYRIFCNLDLQILKQ